MISAKEFLRLIFDLETESLVQSQDKETKDSIFRYVDCRIKSRPQSLKTRTYP